VPFPERQHPDDVPDQMMGRGTAFGQRARRLASAVCVVGVLLALLGASPSAAAPPTLTISVASPQSENTPTFKGTSSIAAEPIAPPIAISIYEGESVAPGSKPVQQLIAKEEPFTTIWEETATKKLADGVYTAVAEQTEGVETGTKEVGFTINTAQPPPPPTVTIAYPLSGSNAVGETQLITGSAGTGATDHPKVKVEVFGGPAASGPAIASVSVQVEKGLWQATVGGLAPRTYTAQAQQEGDGVGKSNAVTFTLAAAPAHPVGTVTPPTASFTWFPAAPAVGQSVVIVSTSSDLTSPITSFAWDPLGNGPFNVTGPVLNTTFTSAGDHTVRLQVADGRGASATASKIIPVSLRPLQLMQPFPIVRIAGVKTSYGVRLNALNVQLPVGARVSVTCKGQACKKLKPVSRVATASATNRHASSVLLAFRNFERAYHAGATLQVRVFAAGEIGKYTSFMIHRHGLPTREDQCLSALDPHPIPCPS
jgi:PKD domain